jgi:hypothetical protein
MIDCILVGSSARISFPTSSHSAATYRENEIERKKGRQKFEEREKLRKMQTKEGEKVSERELIKCRDLIPSRRGPWLSLSRRG